jgi:hypothetical protein
MINFLSKHKVGILATVIFHVALVLYFNTSSLELPEREIRNRVLLELDYTEKEEVIEEISEEIERPTPTEESIDKKIKNLMRDAQDRRKMSSKNYSEQEIEEQLAEKYKKLEQDIIKQREEEGKGFDASKYKIEKTTESTKANTTSAQAENKVSGKVTSECSVPGRECRAKTPSYRCPIGGKIFIDIKVNQKGKITSANYNASRSTSSNECLINEAIKYAKLSSTNQDFNASNSIDGYIIYNFISQ